jgi:hypothetical protein
MWSKEKRERERTHSEKFKKKRAGNIMAGKKNGISGY